MLYTKNLNKRQLKEFITFVGLPSLSLSEIDSGKDSGESVVNESSGDLMGKVGSPLDNGIAGLKHVNIFIIKIYKT